MLVPYFAAAVDSVVPSDSNIENEVESSSTGSVGTTRQHGRKLIYYIDLYIKATFGIQYKREFLTRSKYPENDNEDLVGGLNYTS